MEKPPRFALCFPETTKKSIKSPIRRSSERKSKSDILSTMRTTTLTKVGSPEGENEQLQQGVNACGHGNFQKLIFAFNIVALAVLQCHSQVFALIAPPVDHFCRPTERFSDLSVALWRNVGIPVDESGRYSQCFLYTHPGHANDSTVARCNSWYYDEKQRDKTVRSFWNLVCHRSWLLPLTDAVYMSGALLLVPVAGYLADTSGRQPVIIVAVLVLVFTTIAGCVSESFVLYLVSRFINSACASTVHLLSVILLFEVIPLQFRTFYIGFAFSLGALAASVFVLLLTTLHLEWFLLQLIVVSPTFLLLSAPFVIHESPIWLMSAGHMRKAEAVILTAARINSLGHADAQKAVDIILANMGVSVILVAPMTLKAVIEPGHIRTRASCVFLSTFSAMFAFYMTSTSTHVLKNFAVRVVSTVILGPSYVAMYIALNSMGRLKLLTVLTALLGGLSSLCGIAIYARPIEVFYGLVVIAKTLASVLIPVNFLYLIELFPTPVRSAVLCGAYACGRIGAVLVALLAPLKVVHREDVCFAVAALAAFAATGIVMHLPETSVGIVATAEMDKRKDLMNLMQRSLSPMHARRHRKHSKKASAVNLP